MHILFIGYGKTSQRVAKQLFTLGHQITTISRSPKTDPDMTHLLQDIQQLDLSQIQPVDGYLSILQPLMYSLPVFLHVTKVFLDPVGKKRNDDAD